GSTVQRRWAVRAHRHQAAPRSGAASMATRTRRRPSGRRASIDERLSSVSQALTEIVRREFERVQDVVEPGDRAGIDYTVYNARSSFREFGVQDPDSMKPHLSSPFALQKREDPETGGIAEPAEVLRQRVARQRRRRKSEGGRAENAAHDGLVSRRRVRRRLTP